MKVTDRFSKEEFLARCGGELATAAGIIYDSVRRYEAEGRQICESNNTGASGAGVWRINFDKTSPLAMVMEGRTQVPDGGGYFGEVGKALGMSSTEADVVDDGIKNLRVTASSKFWRLGNAIRSMWLEAESSTELVTTMVYYL